MDINGCGYTYRLRYACMHDWVLPAIIKVTLSASVLSVASNLQLVVEVALFRVAQRFGDSQLNPYTGICRSVQWQRAIKNIWKPLKRLPFGSGIKRVILDEVGYRSTSQNLITHCWVTHLRVSDDKTWHTSAAPTTLSAIGLPGSFLQSETCLAFWGCCTINQWS